jgi:hypothetical protein
MYRERVKENTRRALEWRRKNGMAVSQTGFARQIVVRDRTGCAKPRQQFDKHAGDVKLVEWDTQQLAYIAEITERLGQGEDVARVAADFWARGILDHRDLLWGQVQSKPGKGTGNRYEWYRRAARWFHRAKHKGELPLPYREIAGTIPEPKGFTVEESAPAGRTHARSPSPRASPCPSGRRRSVPLPCCRPVSSAWTGPPRTGCDGTPSRTATALPHRADVAATVRKWLSPNTVPTTLPGRVALRYE